ncbi:uncharacterized protein RB166_003049 [Leptodactylus fuscus]
MTLNCSDGNNTTRNISDLTIIVWRKENGSHLLRFSYNGQKNDSNFTDPRISFQLKQLPLQLKIEDVRPEDAGNYTCDLTMINSGRIKKSWIILISESSSSSSLIYIWPLVAGALVLLVLIAGLVFWKFYKSNSVPSKIHQTSPDNNVTEEPVYENAHEDYFLHFNTLYDRALGDTTAQRADNP